MRLAAVAARAPSRVVTNAEVLSLIAELSTSFDGDLDSTLQWIGAALHRSGARRRHWLHGDESPLALTRAAFDDALEEAGWDRAEIDLLVFAGIDRGFIEPANAYFVANALDLGDVECFDVSDACNGFSRSLQIVEALLDGQRYRRVAIVTAEFGMAPGGAVFPSMFALDTPEQVTWSFPSYTIGEATAVALLSPEGPAWEFRNRSRPDLADLCTIPVQGYERWAPKSARVGAAGLYRFASFGADMEDVARTEIGKMFDDMSISADTVRAVFVHTAAARPWIEAAEERGVEELLVNPYAEYGNVASASIPLGLALAMRSGRVEPGDEVAACVGSAGMAFSVYRWTL